MDVVKLLNAMPGACAQGLIWGLMAIGVYITYKILDLADLTVDGTMCTGGAVCIMMMLNGHSVGFSLLCAFAAGMLAGLVTGSSHNYGNTGDSGRNSDSIRLIFCQSADYGWEIQSGNQCR